MHGIAPRPIPGRRPSTLPSPRPRRGRCSRTRCRCSAASARSRSSAAATAGPRSPPSSSERDTGWGGVAPKTHTRTNRYRLTGHQRSFSQKRATPPIGETDSGQISGYRGPCEDRLANTEEYGGDNSLRSGSEGKNIVLLSPDKKPKTTTKFLMFK